MKHLILFMIIILGFVLLKCISFESFTNTDILSTSTEVKMSEKIGSRGVFATKDYKSGETIEICPCITDKASNFNGKMKDYIFKYDDETALVAFGYCSMYNHSDEYNALWTVVSKDELKVYTTKDISKGEEIFISYGNPYWKSRNDNKK
jgi:SET domain-containing protein